MTSPAPLRIAAILVTYNRVELLKRAVAAIESQSRTPDLLIIVNNASTDETETFLKRHKYLIPTRVRTMRTNTGGAGGFYAGMRAGWELGMDAMWLMDDDTIPRENALEELEKGILKAQRFYGYMPSFAASMVLWSQDGTACSMNYPAARVGWVGPLAQGQDFIPLACCSFVSCLVTREAVRECGFPYPEYFIWFDDAEYTYRLSKWRTGVFIKESLVDHHTPNNMPVYWDQVTDKSLWKYAYGLRNQVSAALSLHQLDILASAFQATVSQLIRRHTVPWSLTAALFSAGIRGLFFRPPKRFPESER